MLKDSYYMYNLIFQQRPDIWLVFDEFCVSIILKGNKHSQCSFKDKEKFKKQ